jgi:hypothetical protein
MLGSFLGKVGVRVGQVWEFGWNFWGQRRWGPQVGWGFSFCANRQGMGHFGCLMRNGWMGVIFGAWGQGSMGRPHEFLWRHWSLSQG